jgi:acyl-coenzyme A thioesterase PaaI-like protein
MSAKESEAAAPTYPPDEHVYRDLGVLVERTRTDLFVSFPIVPEILDAAGRPRLGLLATIADMAAGENAIRSLFPRWVATSSLSVHATDLPTQGRIRARPNLIRQGRTTAVLEVFLDHTPSESAPSESGAADSPRPPEQVEASPIGLSTLSMSILPERRAAQNNVTWADEPVPRTQFATARSGFDRPLLERLGIRFDPADPATGLIECVPYVLNTLGAIQGGIVSLFIEAAAENFAAQKLGCRVQVQSLEVHYLKLCRGNPIRSTVREVSATREGLLLRVELRDEGQEGVLASVGNVLVEASQTAVSQAEPLSP